MEDGELRPMSDAEAASLRARLVELRRADASSVVEAKLTARTAYEQLSQEAAFAGFATVGRVKKLWTRLNAEAREAAERRQAARAPRPVADGLPLWPKGKSIRDALDKGDTSIFTIDEKLQSLVRGGMPQGAEADFRQSLVHMGLQLDAGHQFFILQDDAQQQAIAVVVRSVRVQPSGTPLFEVDFAHKARGGTDVMAHLEMVSAMMALHEGACNVSASLEEQALFISLLEQNVVPRAQCVHPVLHRSCIASPPPAKSAPTQERNSGEKVCAFCSGAARLTCGNCHGVHYCDAACQKKHWKVHRSDCKGESKPIDGESVVIDAAGKDFNGISAYMIMNMRQGAGTRSGSTDEVAHNPHGARRFLIKVQVAQTGRRDPLMMYDQPRAMSRMLLPTEGPAYDTVRDLVRARGVMGGAKAYLWARREGAQLRIFVDPAGMPDQQQPW
jgi:hypothetical protein